jgi:ABC-type uncharacterized transport system fused permease/ATPase subunit
MYARKEHIEEENLNWGEELEKINNAETGSETEETKHIIHPAAEHNKITFKKKVKINQINIKREITNLLAQYSEISLLLSLLIFPYIIGFFVIAFILLTGGVPIDSFFSLKEQIFHFELWSIGSYIFITTGVIWLVIMLLLQRR